MTMGVSVRICMSVALLAPSVVANSNAACMSPAETEPEALGHSMLQTRQDSTPRLPEARSQQKSLSKASVARLSEIVSPAKLLGQGDPCVLPPDAKWCEVRLTNLPPYSMAVRLTNDWVSWNICNTGHWEDQDMSGYGIPGHMLDIGGNVGFQSFAFAHAGWNVTTFEPMDANLALMNATMCKNPKLAAKIHLNPFGLGTATQTCKMMAPKGNVGDGFTQCDAQGEHPSLKKNKGKFMEIGNFAVRRLDEALLQQGITKVDLVKIDVEGYEFQVFKGHPGFLAKYHPRLIKSEVWNSMVGASGVAYLNMFENAGYKFFTNAKCQVPLNAKVLVQQKGNIDVFMCPGSTAT